MAKLYEKHLPRKWIGICLAACQIFAVFSFSGVCLISPVSSEQVADFGSYGIEGSYTHYIKQYEGWQKPKAEIQVDATEGFKAENTECAVSRIDGKNALVWADEKGTVEWQFSVGQKGLYALEMTYFGMEGTGSQLEFELQIDGKIPFTEALQLSMTRLFKDETSEWPQDKSGNDLRVPQLEIRQWISASFRDFNGYVNGNYLFALDEGVHTLKLSAVKEPIAIASFRFYNEDDIVDYQAYMKTQPKAEYTGECLVFEAEKPAWKTSTMLYPISDRSDPMTSPSDPVAKKLNSIGGENWATPNQSIAWNFEAPEDGYYMLAFRFKQNYLRGMNVYRSIAIDGKVPFSELSEVSFPYGVGWQKKIVGDDKPYFIYLTKGPHTLTMTPNSGEMAELITAVNYAVSQLNSLYRRIIMITGTTPDIFRDYFLQEAIPGMTDILRDTAVLLRSVENRVNQLTGNSGTEAATLARMADQLESFVRIPNTIPARLTTFRDNIVTMSSWMLAISRQSLQLDRVYICPKGGKLPDMQSSFFEKATYHLKAFFGSFFTDYETIGGLMDNGEKIITVWIASGRDQAEVLKELIDSKFTRSTGIAVNLRLVQGGLMQAVMARKGPDVAIMLGHGDPVNYAMRGAALPLDGLKGFDDVISKFRETSMKPYFYNGRYYGLPNSQNFFMLFYRTDIFGELGLVPPETWDDLLKVAETLQRKNMNIGLPYVSLDAYASVSTGIGGTSFFPTLLVQNGIGLYSEDEKTTTLNTPEALAAFKTWTDYYTQYGFPLYKDDFNRFRSGEMPLVITNYTFYNQLDTAAPEIRNLWEMELIPGTIQKDGTVTRKTTASGTTGIIIATTKDTESSWEFLKWWNSSEIQSDYGLQIENVLGPAGRYNPANTEAISYLPWTGRELDIIKSQWEEVVELPEPPGSYYVSRNIDNAFKAVYFNHENYREALNYWNKQINDELQRKREEFHITQ